MGLSFERQEAERDAVDADRTGAASEHRRSLEAELRRRLEGPGAAPPLGASADGAPERGAPAPEEPARIETRSLVLTAAGAFAAAAALGWALRWRR